VEASGNIAYEVGAVTLQIQSSNGRAMTDAAKYGVVWKRQADAPWRMAVDIFTRNAPA
jgi:ketosteroid isomerase-like protein